MVVDLVKGKVAIEELIMVQVLSTDPENMVNLTIGAVVALENQKEGWGLAQAKEEIAFVFVRHPTKKNKECNTNEIVMNASKAKETNARLNYDYYVESHIRNPVCKLLGWSSRTYRLYLTLGFKFNKPSLEKHVWKRVKYEAIARRRNKCKGKGKRKEKEQAVVAAVHPSQENQAKKRKRIVATTSP